MDPYETLANKLNSAKEKAKNTEKELNDLSTKICPRCHKVGLDEKYGKVICTLCGYEDKSDRIKIREAFESNGAMTAYELSKSTGLSLSKINAYLDDGVIEVKRNSQQFLKCYTCGTSILNGTVCAKCKTVYKDEFGNLNVREGNSARSNTSTKSEEYKVTGKMHFVKKGK